MGRSLTYCQHLESLRKNLTSYVTLLKRLAGSGWGAGATTLWTATLALVHSTAEYCVPVWCRSAHTHLIDPTINDALQIVTGCPHLTAASNHPTCWALSQRSHTFSSMLCHGAWTSVPFSDHLSNKWECMASQIETPICTHCTTIHQFNWQAGAETWVWLNRLCTSVGCFCSCLQKWVIYGPFCSLWVWCRRTNPQTCHPPMSNPSTSLWTARPDGFGWWDNQIAAQYLPEIWWQWIATIGSNDEEQSRNSLHYTLYTHKCHIKTKNTTYWVSQNYNHASSRVHTYFAYNTLWFAAGGKRCSYEEHSLCKYDLAGES